MADDKLTNRKIRIVVLASTKGTCLQEIIDRINNATLDAELVKVITNKECYAEERAREQGFDTAIIKKKQGESREDYDKRIEDELNNSGDVDLIVLVGYMRLFSKWFVDNHKDKIINIHPSLLPSFPGMDRSVHQDVLDYGCKVTGCTVHLVDEGMDSGPIIMQKCVKIEENETVDSLKTKVQAKEKKIYPEVIQLFADQRIKVVKDKVKIEKSND